MADSETPKPRQCRVCGYIDHDGPDKTPTCPRDGSKLYVVNLDPSPPKWAKTASKSPATSSTAKATADEPAKATA